MDMGFCAPGYQNLAGKNPRRPRMDMTTRPPCLLCGKPLQVVGTARKNGVQRHADWQGRKYHKQCWAKLNPSSHKRPTFFSGQRGGRRGKWKCVSNYV